MDVYIYTLSDPITGEIRYVGRTIRKLSSRLYQHVFDSKKRSHYNHNWIWGLSQKKLIPKIEQLDVCDENSWAHTEQYWISQFKTWGFRLTNDNEGGYGNLSPSKETRMKIANNLEKEILQYSTNGDFIMEFKSLKTASKATNVKASQISRNLNKESIYSKNFIWKLKDSENFPKKILGVSNPKKKSVLQYDLNGNLINKHNSVLEAANSTNTCQTSISQCCNSRLKSANGFMWRYPEGEFDQKINKHFKKKTFKKVVQYSKDSKIINEFESLKEAQEKTGVDQSNISNCCHGKMKSSGGFLWRFKE